ncbi:MAG: FAD-dependent oxidoreductase [Chloroflexia bacterium]
MPHDVVVIGAGLAGLIGGLRLAEAGRRVLLLAKGHGTTHWANGAIGVAHGDAPRRRRAPGARNARSPLRPRRHGRSGSRHRPPARHLRRCRLPARRFARPQRPPPDRARRNRAGRALPRDDGRRGDADTTARC